MIHLILSIIIILVVYAFLFFLVMKREIAWKYKALIYGVLTFIMLVSTFLTFSYYDNHWKQESAYSGDSASGRRAE